MFSPRILQDPSERLVEFLIVVFEVRVVQRVVKDEFIEGLDKVALEQLLIHEGFSHEFTNELE